MTDPEGIQLATIDWTRGKWSHAKGKYAREHTWHLAGGTKLKATDTDAMLPEGYRDKRKRVGQAHGFVPSARVKIASS
jgi:hypothetical protein